MKYNINQVSEKEFKELQTFEVLYIEYSQSASLFTSVMRVPNGHIYRSFDKETGIMGMVFVPKEY